jgi:ATP-dependent Clp protease ATP-binding subunit ClpC
MNHFASLSRQTMMAVQIASAASRDLQHYYLGVEHIVLGLCQLTNTDLQVAMRKAAFDLQLFRRHLGEALSPGPDPIWGTRLIVTPRLITVVQLAEKIAQHWQKQEVEPTHLLLAVLVEGGSIPVRVLRHLGWDLAALQTRLYERLQGKRPASHTSHTPASTPYLDAVGRDLTALARQGRLRPAIGRKAETLAVAQVLARLTKNNPLLIGEPGVGKTSIVEGLAQHCIGVDAPEALRGKRIVEIPMGMLVAGTQYRGAFEQKLEGLLTEASSHPEVILFVDEIHTLIGAGSGGGSTLDAANMFKPALGRGEIRCIGATTVEEYHRHIAKDAALQRRFEVIRVAEPSPEETLNILLGLKASLESHHSLTIADEAVQEAVRLGARYIPDRHFPDKAIDILDRACSVVRLQSLTGPAQAGRVTKEAVAHVVSQTTGIPVGSLTQEDTEVLLHLEERLRQRVIGQEEAVATVAHTVIAARQLHSRRRPHGVFLFLGPTGVGKTELAKSLAAVLFGSEAYLVRFDMSEYMERHTAMRLIGAPPSYVGYEDEGQLTGAVRRRPYSILLFDEIEKAHPDIMHMFLQVFDDGRLTDNKGRTVDFSHTLIIMTSNLGSEASAGVGRGLGFGTRQEVNTEEARQAYVAAVHKAVTQAFRPEFINRIDELVVFNPLRRKDLQQIVSLLLQEVEVQLVEKGLCLSVAEEVRALLLTQGFSDIYGARELRRAVERLVRQPLAQFLLGQRLPAGTTIQATRSGNEVQFSPLTGPRAGE